jgi:hypothetical protein
VVISGTSSGKDVRDYFKQYGVCDFISKTEDEIWDKLKQLAQSIETNSQPPAECRVDLDALRRQLRQEQENLRLIQERKAEYVLATDIPLDLVKRERQLMENVAKLEQKINSIEDQRRVT